MKQVQEMLSSEPLMIYNVSDTSFIKVYIKMTASLRFFLLCDIKAHGPPLYMLNTIKPRLVM